MEGFPGSLNGFMHGSFTDSEVSLSEGVPCSSIEDMHAQLQTAFDHECTPTRAKHTTTTFQFPLDTTFHIPLDELKGLLAPQDENESALLVPIAEQKILVKDAVLNQRPNSHTLQMLAAKYITSRIGDVDASQWVVKDAKWERLGWVFTCICVQSMEHWQKQADEMKEKPILAEFIHKEPEPILANRPIYDCFGTLTLIFSTSHRSILAEYSHTPLHRLVSDIFALMAPTPISPVAAGRRRRRRRPQFVAISPDNQPVSQENAPKKRKARKSIAQSPQKQVPNPDASVGDLSVVLATVDPGERQKRRDAAQALLREAGIDSTTLSEDQFSILSNQSPNLQQESIAMLKQYGAERLRIVYPDATSSVSPSQSTTENEAPSTPISKTTASKSSPTKRKRGRPRKSKALSTSQGTVVSNTEDDAVAVGLKASTVEVAIRASTEQGVCS
ncbi:hypothetical protein CFIMG_000401RA [Ceratocystis fimbriata CBS 114723]|uniref:Uncharacterized protein n=1 Tax=Ceratocystis fimbriata CBS 114723 TaxID=1035309 RepID=A0A2C5XJX0_9PEZI|nr:hypothetical protein CFIMG_000401RA [Ceratocystis fimbriata CBS 114723]